MDDIVNALKLPFMTVPPEERPSDRVVVVVWALVGVAISAAFK